MMFIVYLLTLTSIPLFLFTFVVFYGVCSPSIDFVVYSAVSIDCCDVSNTISGVYEHHRSCFEVEMEWVYREFRNIPDIHGHRTLKAPHPV
jgi:hypothetical protein